MIIRISRFQLNNKSHIENIGNNIFEYLYLSMKISKIKISWVTMNRVLEDVIHRHAANTDRITAENTLGYVVSDNTTGNVAATSFDNTSAQGIVKHMNGILVGIVQSAIRDLDPTNKLCYLRVQTRKFEYLVAPEELFTITVLQ